MQALSLYFDGDCYNMTFSFFKGRMVFQPAEQRLEWIPTSALFKKKFCTGTPSERIGTQADLDRSKATYYYKFYTPPLSATKYLMLYTDKSMGDQFWTGTYEIIRQNETDK